MIEEKIQEITEDKSKQKIISLLIQINDPEKIEKLKNAMILQQFLDGTGRVVA